MQQADEAIRQAQTATLEQEKLANAQMKEELDRLSTEKSLSEERFKSEIAELKARLGREQSSAKKVQADMASEINVS